MHFFDLPQILLFEIGCQWIDTVDLCLLDTAVVNSALRPYFLANLASCGASTDIRNNSPLRNNLFRNWVIVREMYPLVWCNLFPYSTNLKFDRLDSFIFFREGCPCCIASMLKICWNVKHLEVSSGLLFSRDFMSEHFVRDQVTHLTLNDSFRTHEINLLNLMRGLGKFTNCHHLVILTTLMHPNDFMEVLINDTAQQFSKVKFTLTECNYVFKTEFCAIEKTFHFISDGCYCDKFFSPLLQKVGAQETLKDFQVIISLRQPRIAMQSYPEIISLEQEAAELSDKFGIYATRMISHGVEIRFSDFLGKNAKFLRVHFTGLRTP